MIKTKNPNQDSDQDPDQDDDDDQEAQLTPSELVSILNNGYSESCAKDFLNESDLSDKMMS